MNRLAGIVIAFVGVLVIVLSVAGVLPGLTGVGVLLILLGLLMIGLSFINGPQAAEGEETPPKMSTAATLGNIFFSPGETFRNLRRFPRWLVVVLIMVVMGNIYYNAFMYRVGSDRVVNYTVDKTLQMGMISNNEQAKAQVEKGRPQALADNKDPVKRTAKLASDFAGLTFVIAFLSLVFFLFVMAMGGSINYWQAFSVAAYAIFPVTLLRNILNLIILFIKDPDDIHPIIGQGSLVTDSLNFFVNPAESPALYALLGSFSLLGFYWLWLNATGLKNGGERVSSTTAWAATITIWVLGTILSVIFSSLFSSFLS